MSTFSPNVQFEEVARGGDVGTWDTPTNSNWTIADLVVGGIATIPLNNSNIVLSAAQFQCRQLTFNSTLTGNVTITFPTSFTKSYDIQNLCSASSAFTITLSNGSGGQVICAPPGEIVEIVNDGTNVNYRNLGRVGSYLDLATTAVPNWINGCSPQLPYLSCTGQSFNQFIYPVLTSLLGGTTLPDCRGRYRAGLNQGLGTLTTAGAGIDGNTLLAVGGNNGISANLLPGHTHGVTDPGHSHGFPGGALYGTAVAQAAPQGGNSFIVNAGGFVINSGVTGISIQNNTAVGTMPNAPPGYVGGITLIRAG